MPDGTSLPKDYALQDPEDHIFALKEVIKGVMQGSGVPKESVTGIGLDATSCTLLAVDTNGEPFTRRAKYANRPESYVRLWKHHAAQKEADEIYAILREKAPDLLPYYGNHISSEWMFPKLLEIKRKSPDLYAAADRFLDLPDYLTFILTGQYTANACAAGYKALWQKGKGYPDAAVLSSMNPDFVSLPETKLRAPVKALGERVGTVSLDIARELGLSPHTAVAVGNMDAHVSVPGAGSANEGTLLMIIGTSTCAMLVSKKENPVSGICGLIEG